MAYEDILAFVRIIVRDIIPEIGKDKVESL
jgi:hypothetical protein